MQFSVNLSGRTAVRPYKKNMILNGITDQEDWLPALPNLPGAQAPASLPEIPLILAKPALDNLVF
jgi:hypothetical protein